MDSETQSATEVRALCALCDRTRPRQEQQALMQSLGEHIFIEPEHQVVFESIRVLFPRGPISASQLRVHLNNRGFPDTDVDRYFQPTLAARLERRSPGQRNS